MSLTILPELEQRSEEWHAQRRGIVTASVVGRLISVRPLTASEYDCPDCGVFAGDPCLSQAKRKGQPAAIIKTLHAGRTARAIEKRDESPLVLGVATGDEAQGLTALLTAERITGYTDPTYLSSDMLRGIDDEPVARDLYAEHFAPVTTVGFMLLEQDGWRLGCSPDGLVGDDGMIEIKSRRQKTQLTTVLADEVPSDNVAQLQCALLVSGRKWIDYVSFSGGLHLWRKRVYPDPKWFEAIIAAVKQFEHTSAEMVARYNAATRGLPMTERRTELEMVI